MGLYDRDYMRRDDRPPPPAGGRAGFFAFLAVLLALILFAHRAHPRLLRDFVIRPWTHLAHRLAPASHGPEHSRQR